MYMYIYIYNTFHALMTCIFLHPPIFSIRTALWLRTFLRRTELMAALRSHLDSESERPGEALGFSCGPVTAVTGGFQLWPMAIWGFP